MFEGATNFNKYIGNWNVSSGTYFYEMFKDATNFNVDISGWDVSNGESFDYMFRDATFFDQDIGGWDVSSGMSFSYMFRGASWFNQDISGWDVSSANDFSFMFWGAEKFNQDIRIWHVDGSSALIGMFTDLMVSKQGFDQSPRISDFYLSDTPSTPDLATASDTYGDTSDNFTSDNTPTFTGTSVAESTIEVFADGSSLGTTTADSNGNWSFTVSSCLLYTSPSPRDNR